MSLIVAQVARGLKATYNFFVGDAIILVAVLLAFGVGALLAHLPGIANPIVAVVIVGIIVAGLVATLGRELVDHRR